MRSEKSVKICEICVTFKNQCDIKKISVQMKKRIVEVAVKVIVAALTAFLTAITTTSCMGLGPF